MVDQPFCNKPVVSGAVTAGGLGTHVHQGYARIGRHM